MGERVRRYRAAGMSDTLDDLNNSEFIHAALRGDVNAIRRYGESNRESWGGVRFQNEPKIRIVASFTDDLDQHEDALRQLLKYPDRLVLERVRWTHADLEEIRKKIHHTLDSRQTEFGRPVMAHLVTGIGVVSVGLQADQEALAKEIFDCYGDAIALDVGVFSYPMGRPGSREIPLRDLEPDMIDIEGLELRLKPERRVVEMGDHGRGDLIVRNVGAGHIGPLQSGRPLLGVLLNEAGDIVGGSAPATVRGTGFTIDLDPREEVRVKVLFGTASYKEEFGYLLTPGRYWLRSYLSISKSGPSRVCQMALRVPTEEG